MVKKALLTVMAADIVGYSRMMGLNEAGTLQAVKAWRRDVFDPAVAIGGGHILKLMGDGALVTFPSPSQAVECALRIQAAMSRYTPEIPPDQRIVVRIGINMGAVIIEDGDIYGDEVNIAARLEGMAPPGGLLISQAVRDAVDSVLDTHFHDNGLRKFKNISRLIPVWSWPCKLPEARADQKPRVVVRKFAGADDGERQLASDLENEIRTELSRLTGLELVSTAEGAHLFLEGSVRLAAGRCRVQVRLLDVEDGRQAWAERYNEDGQDFFAIVDALAPSIVMAIRRHVALADAARLRNRPLDELSASELLALGGTSFFNPTIEGWRGGGLLAEQALEVAPDHFMALAMAAAGLGLAEFLYAHRPVPPDALDHALERIERGLRANSRSDMLHAVHSGLLLYGYRRYREAQGAAMRSLDVNPNYNMGFWMLGAVQVFGGDAEAAAQSAERAVSINRGDPYMHQYCRIAGYAHLDAGRPDVAVDWLDRADQLAPGIVPNLAALAVALQRAGDVNGAAQTVDRLLRIEPGFRVADAHPLPYRDPGHWIQFVDSLRTAGAP